MMKHLYPDESSLFQDGRTLTLRAWEVNDRFDKDEKDIKYRPQLLVSPDLEHLQKILDLDPYRAVPKLVPQCWTHTIV